MNDPLDLHITDVGTWRLCRRKWWFGSRHARNRKPIEANPNFYLGSAVHYMLEHWRLNGMPPQDSLDEYVADATTEPRNAEELLALSMGMMKHFMAWSKRQKDYFAERNFEVIGTEVPFKIQLWDGYDWAPDLELHGALDIVLRHREDDTIWIGDYKTARSPRDRIATLPLDWQASAYILAGKRIYGDAFQGMIYTMLKKSLPKKPEPVRSGKRLSHTTKGCTFESYVEAIKEFHGEEATTQFIRENYSEPLSDLAGEDNDFFQRVPIRRSEMELAMFEGYLIHAGREMKQHGDSNYDDPAMYFTEGRHCGICDFRNPCHAMQRREHEAILDARYTANKREKDIDEAVATALEDE